MQPGVDWYTARDFCRWAAAHWRLPADGVIDLPTSAEWEIATPRGTERAFPWGDDPPGSRDDARAAYAWPAPPPLRPGATPVGAFPRGHTPDRLWDLAGNVFEWCATGIRFDALDLPIADEEDDPGGEVVYRGGCWQRPAHGLSVTDQGDHRPGGDGNWISFRVVSVLPVALSQRLRARQRDRDRCRSLPRLRFEHWFGALVQPRPSSYVAGELWRVTLDRNAGTATAEPRWAHPCEFPRVAPAVEATRHTIGWLAAYSRSDGQLVDRLPDAVAKVDVETGRDSVWSSDGGVVSEPIFVPKPRRATVDQLVELLGREVARPPAPPTQVIERHMYRDGVDEGADRRLGAEPG